MFCALITLLQYFKSIKQGGCFAPSHFTGGGKTTPLFYIYTNTVSIITPGEFKRTPAKCNTYDCHPGYFYALLAHQYTAKALSNTDFELMQA